MHCAKMDVFGNQRYRFPENRYRFTARSVVKRERHITQLLSALREKKIQYQKFIEACRDRTLITWDSKLQLNQLSY